MRFKLVETILPGGSEVKLRPGNLEIEFFSKELEERFFQKNQELVYAAGDRKLEEIVVKELDARGLSLATAESCSGGLLSSRIVSIPGASRVFLGGIVAYSNRAKVELLGVREEDLMAFGAVSQEVCLQMSKGAKARFGADIGIGITGIAGPGGATPQKPVGLTYIGVCIFDKSKVWRFEFLGSREENQFLSTQWAMELLRRELKRI
ncbi:MAG: CinA family protein [Aquificaceae bacterium]